MKDENVYWEQAKVEKDDIGRVENAASASFD